MKIVLASQSPRRRELLGKMGLEFTTKAPEIDETALSGLPAAESAKNAMETTKQWIQQSLQENWKGMGLPVERYF